MLLDANFGSFEHHNNMKDFYKKFVLHLLVWLAQIRLKRLRPFIIAITGSVGKTSVKEAIYTILRERYKVIRNEKSYNTDFGLPLAILEQQSGFSSPIKWLKIIFQSFLKAFWGGHGLQMMVLEMGVDKPGDMDQLLKLIRPQIAIVTNIKPVHLAEGQFKSEDDIFLEKSKLANTLPEKGIAILNHDDPYLTKLGDILQCRKIYYGIGKYADLRLLQCESSLETLYFTISYKDQIVTDQLALPGKLHAYIILPVIATALTQGFTLEEAVNALKNYRLPPGRMSFIPGILDTTIIDSSYNASPASIKEALDVLAKANHGRRIAVLGNMNELGVFAEHYHREIGRYVVEKADILITIGNHARFMAEESKKHGFPAEAVFNYSDALEATDALKKILQKNDIVLIKGSQNEVRLERMVKLLMKEPNLAEELLVRQEKSWLQI